MRLTTNTPDLLIVEERPWIMGLFFIVFILIFAAVGLFMLTQGELWGIAFLLLGSGIGLLFMFIFVRRVQAVFHRPEGWVEIRRANLRGRRKVRHALPEVSRAIVETSYSDGTQLRRVTLEIDAGESAGRHPLTAHYSNIGRHQAAADAINTWLAVAR